MPKNVFGGISFVVSMQSAGFHYDRECLVHSNDANTCFSA